MLSLQQTIGNRATVQTYADYEFPPETIYGNAGGDSDVIEMPPEIITGDIGSISGDDEYMPDTI